MAFFAEYVQGLFDSRLRRLYAAGSSVAAVVAFLLARGSLVWVIVVLIAVVIAQALYAYDRWAHGPRLQLEPEVTRPRQVANPQSGNVIAAGRFVVVNVANVGSAPARDVYCWLTFTDLDGERLLKERFPARWSNTPQPSASADGPFAHIGRELAELPELPANGRPETLDVLVKFSEPDEGLGCYVWTNQSMLDGVRTDRYRLDRDEFKVEVSVRGSGGLELDQTYRIENRVIPQVHSL